MTQSKDKSLAILGAGAWGTALAILVARNGVRTHLWGNEPDTVQTMIDERCNQAYLPDIKFPEPLHIYHDSNAALAAADDILLAVPSHAFAQVLALITPNENTRIAWATKGLLPENNALLHTAITQKFSNIPTAVISGPSFAREVAENLPTAVTLASHCTTFANDLSDYLQNQHFTVDINTDITGVELGGIMKNVIAIATGLLDGAGFGANARAALMTRGLAEMTHLGVALGAQAETFTGLSGIGDLILTCTDNQSRNRRFGLALGQGKSVEQALAAIGQVVEGYHNTEQLFSLARQHQIELPIVNQIHAIFQQQAQPKQVAERLVGLN